MKFNKFLIAFGITALISSVVDAKKYQFKDDDDGDDLVGCEPFRFVLTTYDDKNCEHKSAR